MPRRTSTVIRTATRADLAAMRAIVDAQVGHGYLDAEVDALYKDSEGFALVAVVDGSVAGVCMCSIMKPGAMARIFRSGLPDVLRSRKVGLLDTLAVRPDLTGRGLGTALLEEARGRFRSDKVRVWATPAWRSRLGTTVESLLTRAGMEPFAEVPDFWREASLAEGFICPVCGAPPCECSAVMYAGPT
ncbi:Predicted N-acetyltransferase YhbS [Raineyella antarctica]|uniref:Predicted N-acetyltransferase YhbS n=1 Tax=Raineyella antarctica TaxID=1577474 RepID=A0A1G6HEF6_9ACTN|nr:GNAT family N-acetyltransferase [Raineyella antarctica]SDB92488.1 Predicted N-acetyltransferase YhbS [Raineyella antarctica]